MHIQDMLSKAFLLAALCVDIASHTHSASMPSIIHIWPLTAAWHCSLGLLMYSMAEGTAPFRDVPDEVQLHWLRVSRFLKSKFCHVLVLILAALLLISLFAYADLQIAPIAHQLLLPEMPTLSAASGNAAWKIGVLKDG